MRLEGSRRPVCGCRREPRNPCTGPLVLMACTGFLRGHSSRPQSPPRTLTLSRCRRHRLRPISSLRDLTPTLTIPRGGRLPIGAGARPLAGNPSGCHCCTARSCWSSCSWSSRYGGSAVSRDEPTSSRPHRPARCSRSTLAADTHRCGGVTTGVRAGPEESSKGMPISVSAYRAGDHCDSQGELCSAPAEQIDAHDHRQQPPPHPPGVDDQDSELGPKHPSILRSGRSVSRKCRADRDHRGPSVGPSSRTERPDRGL
jgi:hypothetical protein